MLRTVRPFIPSSPPLPPSPFANNKPGTQWPPTGGSLVINGSHAHAFTYVNLALGSNATNFNITLLDVFNQTGAGIFCTKETGKSYLDAAFKAAGYSGSGDERLDGTLATVQVIQLGGRGSALYNVSFLSVIFFPFFLWLKGEERLTISLNERNKANVHLFQCADIVFNSSAPLLGDDECKNGTGVGGVALENAGASTTESGNTTAETPKPNAASGVMVSGLGSVVIAAVVAWMLV